MKRRMLALVLCILMLLSLSTPGLADLKRGSRGEEVQYIQEMLIEMGFLDDVADGVFGKKTEAAVKALQTYLGMKATGKVDEMTQVRIYDLDSIATGMMADDGLGEDELMEIYPQNCSWEGEDEWGAVFCYRHQEEYLVSKQLAVLNPPKKLEKLLRDRLYELWEDAIVTMYDEWLENGEEEEWAAITLEKKLFEATCQNMADGLDKDLWIEEKGISMCLKVYGEIPDGYDDSEDEDET